MKKLISYSIISVTITLLFFVVGVHAWQGGQNNYGNNMPADPNNNNQPTEALSAEELLVFDYILEEEKLARDVYLALGEVWEVRIFNNIASSEEQHINAMVGFGQRYDLDISIIDKEPGFFKRDEFQQYYDDLVEIGMSSLTEALAAGLIVEELDINDIQESLLEVENVEFRTVLQNLLKGSRNHLRSFYSHLKVMGGDYDPEFLSEQEFTDIVNSPMERGRVDQHGNPVSNREGESHRGNQGDKGGQGERGERGGQGERGNYGECIYDDCPLQ